jgi:transporter family protein
LFLNLLILLSNFCWGFWGIFDKKALESSNSRTVLLTQYALALPEILLLSAYMLATRHSVDINVACAFWSMLGSGTATMAMVAYMVAMSKAEASFVLGITASYPLVMQLLASMFLGETLVGNRIIGSILIGAGVFAIGGSAHQSMRETTRRDRIIVTVCVVLATIGWGIHGLFDKKALSYAPPLVVMVARLLFDLVTFALMYLAYLRLGIDRRLSNPSTWKLCGCSALCLFVGYIAYLSAMTIASASYVIVITGCYPLLMYIFALIFLKEKLNWYRLLGVSLVVAGGALVQLTQAS